jgi:uncharacterized MAPEG superfamily protein
MPAELRLLIWSVALTFLQMLVAAAGAALVVGLPTLVGNRENMPKLSGWAGRACRAHYNMLENMAVFAPLVVVGHLTGRNNARTVLGAEIFFFARLLYAFIYVIGIPYLRTAVWTASIIGLIIIFSQLI